MPIWAIYVFKELGTGIKTIIWKLRKIIIMKR